MNESSDKVGFDLALAFADDEKVPEVEMRKIERPRGQEGAPFCGFPSCPSPSFVRPQSRKTNLPSLGHNDEIETTARVGPRFEQTQTEDTDGSFRSDLSQEEKEILSLRPRSVNSEARREPGFTRQRKRCFGLMSQIRRVEQKGTSVNPGRVGNTSAVAKDCVNEAKIKVRRVVRHELFAPCARTCVVLSIIVIFGVFAVSFIGWTSSTKIIRDGETSEWCICSCIF